MWKFLGFGVSKRTNLQKPVTAAPGRDAPLALLTKRRELVRVVLRDVLRKNGIPVDWIGFEIVPLVRTAEHDPLHLLQLVVMQWNEHWMNFAPAFEEQLWRGLIRFDPEIERSELLLGWRFAPDCACPWEALPEPAFWASKAAPSATAAPATPKKFDLPPSEYDHRSSGFAPTEPGGLA